MDNFCSCTDANTEAPPTTTPLLSTTTEASGSGGFDDIIDYDDYDDNSTSEDEGNKEGLGDVFELIDDEDYGGDEMGGVVGGATQTRRKREDETHEDLLTMSYKPRLPDASVQYEYHETSDPYQNIPKSK